MKERSEGFTIVELLIVIVIIGILSAVVVPNIVSAINKARDAEDAAEYAHLTDVEIKAKKQYKKYLAVLETNDILSREAVENCRGNDETDTDSSDMVTVPAPHNFFYVTDENTVVYISDGEVAQ